MSFSVGLDVVGKELELLKETVPNVRRVAVLSNPGNPGNVRALKTVEATARALSMQLQILEARGPNEFEAACAAMARERAGLSSSSRMRYSGSTGHHSRPLRPKAVPGNVRLEGTHGGRWPDELRGRPSCSIAPRRTSTRS